MTKKEAREEHTGERDERGGIKRTKCGARVIEGGVGEGGRQRRGRERGRKE